MGVREYMSKSRQSISKIAFVMFTLVQIPSTVDGSTAIRSSILSPSPTQNVKKCDNGTVKPVLETICLNPFPND